MPHLVEMQNEFEDVAVIGMTEVTLDEAAKFRRDFDVNYAVLANATPSFERYGIKTVWTSPVYLVDPDGRIVGKGIEQSTRMLRERG